MWLRPKKGVVGQDYDEIEGQDDDEIVGQDDDEIVGQDDDESRSCNDVPVEQLVGWEKVLVNVLGVGDVNAKINFLFFQFPYGYDCYLCPAHDAKEWNVDPDAKERDVDPDEGKVDKERVWKAEWVEFDNDWNYEYDYMITMMN